MCCTLHTWLGGLATTVQIFLFHGAIVNLRMDEVKLFTDNTHLIFQLVQSLGAAPM
jgi:hypothetical protein